VNLTRHARNRSRLYGVGLDEIQRILETGDRLPPDVRGNRRTVGTTDNGRELVIVVALDNPNLVITLIEWRSR